MPCLLPVQYIQFQTRPLLILHHDIIHILTLTSKVYLPKDHKWFYPDSVLGCRTFSYLGEFFFSSWSLVKEGYLQLTPPVQLMFHSNIFTSA